MTNANDNYTTEENWEDIQYRLDALDARAREDLSHMTAVAEKCLADMERKLRANQDHPIFGSYHDASLIHFYTFGEIQDKVAAAISMAAANDVQRDNAYRVATTFAQDFPTQL